MKMRILQILSVMMVLGLVLSACQPQVVEVEKEVVVTQVVREEVEVEKVVEVEVETVVEKVVEVEKATEDALGFVDIAPGEPVHIAYMLATSGAVEFLGADSLGGIEIAIEEYGQLHGHDILLTGEDSLCSAEGGQTAAVKVAADPTILGVLGTNCSSAGTAASVVISEAGMVMISPTNTSPALTDPNETWNPGYYRTAHNDNFQGAVAAEFVYNVLGARTAAALHDGDPYTEGLASVFAEVFAEIGGTVTSFEAVNKGDTDMRPVLTTIAAGGPEVLYFPIFEPEGNFVGAQSQEVPGLESVTLMGADGLLVKSFGPATGPAAVGMYLSGPYISEDISAYASFLAKYEANTGGPPPAGFAAHAYDGANILLASIAKAAIVDDDGTLHVGRQALRDAVGSTYRYGGLTGILSCDEYGDCATGEALAVFQLSADNVASADNWPPAVVYTPSGGAQKDESAKSDEKAVVVKVVGGGWGEALKASYFDGLEAETGVRVIYDMGWAAGALLKAQNEVGRVEWDIAMMDEGDIVPMHKEGLIDTIDYSQLDPDVLAQIPEDFKQPWGILHHASDWLIVYDTTVFSGDNVPTTWADFWDVDKFPGPRSLPAGTYSPPHDVAWLAMGWAVDDFFPLDMDKMDQGWAKLEEIKPHISRWWESGGESWEVVANGEAVMSVAWSDRVIRAMEDGENVAPVWNDHYLTGLGWWVLPANSPHKDEYRYAMLNYGLRAESQAKMLAKGYYKGWSNSGVAALAPEHASKLPTSPELLPLAIGMNKSYNWGETAPGTDQTWYEWYAEKWPEFVAGTLDY